MFKKITVTPVEDAQTISSKATQPSSDFFSDLFNKFDDIKQGNKVRVVGKDKYKGHIGIIVRTFVTQHNEHMFTIQLQTTGDTIDRSKSNVKRYYD